MKTTTSGLKIVILGASKVGKSAVAVRFLTKRFIGEYCSGFRLFLSDDVQIRRCCGESGNSRLFTGIGFQQLSASGGG
ncbi:ras-like protein family member 11B [Pomacea canaliculata]|uniref:ras-like protein family member 11B n=1 Tax=Pomacea canaliculata TaxID=400727 RepID=UPI000D735D61|nr:ras-like protein family member 11B [Pomacea canaliculata]